MHAHDGHGELLDYSGHVSARIPGTDRFLIPPRDASRAGLSPDEILVVDINGKVLEGKGPAPTETAIHSGVYRHRPMCLRSGTATRRCRRCSPWSTARWWRCAITASASSASRSIPTRPISAPSRRATRSPRRSASAAVACCAATAAWSRASSIPEVFLDSLEMEENARSTVHASTLGKLLPITPEEVELLKVSFARNTYRIAKTWEHYQEKAKLAGML
jgi:hypothetical protein